MRQCSRFPRLQLLAAIFAAPVMVVLLMWTVGSQAQGQTEWMAGDVLLYSVYYQQTGGQLSAGLSETEFVRLNTSGGDRIDQEDILNSLRIRRGFEVVTDSKSAMAE